MQQGSIVSVGLGMVLGAHISPLCRNFIEQADVVFVSASEKLVEMWVTEMNANTISLQQYYQEGKNRRTSYQQMVDAMMMEVRNGKNVVGAFYGHPGVFAWAPHKVLEIARKEGFHAHMEPGISAEACLYADMGIDPGKFGIQHLEATQFMMFERMFDLSAYLILWQIGFAGDQSFSKYVTDNQSRGLLKDLLLEYYPSQHKIAIYEAATLPTEQCRQEWLPLELLDQVSVRHHSTLVIPPLTKKLPDKRIRELLAQLP